MTSITVRIIAPLTTALAASLASLGSLGCKQESAPTTRPIDVRKEAYWQETPLRVAQDPVCVVQGPTPLVHLFDVGGPIRVVDLTAQRPLIAMEVRDRTLVRIDDRNGVTFGSDNVVPGPLLAGHLYGIYADPTTENVMRRGIGPPGNTVNSQSGQSGPSR